MGQGTVCAVSVCFVDRNENAAAKQDKLVGAKFTAVNVLLKLPESTRNKILHTVSCYGWEGVLLRFCQCQDDVVLQIRLTSSSSLRLSLHGRLSLLEEAPSGLQSQVIQDAEEFSVAEEDGEYRGKPASPCRDDREPMGKHGS